MAASGRNLSTSLSSEIDKATTAIQQCHLLLKKPNASHLVVNEHLLSAATRIGQIHAAIKSYSVDFEKARQVKEAALKQLAEHENGYSEALESLSGFLANLDTMNDEVRTIFIHSVVC